MNRVVGLLLAGLVLLLLGITLTPSQPAQAQVCPASGDEPSTDCDAAGNCFHHCCLTWCVSIIFEKKYGNGDRGFYTQAKSIAYGLSLIV